MDKKTHLLTVGTFFQYMYSIFVLALTLNANQGTHEQPPKFINLEENVVGKWCVVEYDGAPYPGIIQVIQYKTLVIRITLHVLIIDIIIK